MTTNALPEESKKLRFAAPGNKKGVTAAFRAYPNTFILRPYKVFEGHPEIRAVKELVLAWWVTEKMTLIAMTAISTTEDYFPLLTPDGQVETGERIFCSFENWLRHENEEMLRKRNEVT